MRSCTWDVCCLLSAAHSQAAPLFMSTSASPEASDRKTKVFSLPKQASFAPCYLRQGMLYSPGAMCAHPEASAGITSAIPVLHDFKLKMTNWKLIWKPCSA